mgnify:CR=1 FL=1
MPAPERPWRTYRRRLELAVAPRLISAFLTLLSWTVRLRLLRGDDLLARWGRGERVILAFWHNRAIVMPLQLRGQRLCIMNSQSHDGEIATRALERWGIRSVRGSATRGGLRGFMQLLDAYRKGENLAVVPDGPRGPRCEAKPGIVHLAKATGAPLFPVSYAASRFLELRSWDRLIIPLPFARIDFAVEEPLFVARDANEEELEAARLELQARLDRAGATAAAALAG